MYVCVRVCVCMCRASLSSLPSGQAATTLANPLFHDLFEVDEVYTEMTSRKVWPNLPAHAKWFTSTAIAVPRHVYTTSAHGIAATATPIAAGRAEFDGAHHFVITVLFERVGVQDAPAALALGMGPLRLIHQELVFVEGGGQVQVVKGRLLGEEATLSRSNPSFKAGIHTMSTPRLAASQ